MPEDLRPALEVPAAPRRGGGFLSVAGVAQAYGATRVLADIDLDVARGGFVALVGPSGCGKSTLLKLVAGLIAPIAGSIRIGDRLVADAASALCLPPERRDLGMVFQDYALWPHLSIADNVGFPLEMRGVKRPERGPRIEEALAQVGLAGQGARFPAQLSGGQQQRVALARAIVARPGVILFDEPLSNLDKELRDTLGPEMAALCRTLGLTAIYVTHDLGEAFALADEVAVMRAGRILQIGAPERLVDQPATADIAEFLKLGAILPARIAGGRLHLADTVLALPGHKPRDGAGALLLRSQALTLAPNGSGDLAGSVSERRFRGDGYAIAVRIAAELPPLQLFSAERIELGTRVAIAVDRDQTRWFPHD